MQAHNTLGTLPALVDLTDAHIVDAAREAGEPAWLIERRREAWHFFAEALPPVWRRTDLTKFDSGMVVAPLGTSGTTLVGSEQAAAQGAVFTTLAAGLQSHADLIKQRLFTAVEPLTHKFTALHAALWQDGVFLYVPRHVSVELPLRALFTMNDRAIFPHNLIVVERGARVTFVEEYVSPDSAEQLFASPTTEIFLDEDASLRFVTVQTWGAGVYHIGGQRARVGRNASLEWVALNLGGQLQHVEAETSLEGDGSHVDWVAATLADGTQSLLTAPWLRHVGANTEGHMDFKTVVKDESYTTFDGMIKIEHESRGTISRLEEHALHLSPKARSDSIPGLKIETNDVQKAGHASTSGQVDEEMLFYMLSRGVRHEDAIHMIVMGFFEPVLDRIPLEEVRERITGMIERKIA